MGGLGILSVVGLFGGYILAEGPPSPIQEFGIDRLTPIHADRQITTTSLHWRAREKALAPGRAELRLGATVSRATGRIVQPVPGGLAVLDSPGWGAGPAVDLRLTLLQQPSWQLQLHGSAAVLLHDRRFPAGGDRYNGMFRVGPSVAAERPGGARIELGWTWMHVSNGQGLGAHNPSYEARGWSLRWQLPL